MAQRRSPAHLLRIAALGVLLGTLAYWGLAGAHRGWSQNQVPVKKTDEVTGIEYLEYERRFVPGIDVLGIGTAAAFLLLTTSFFIGKSKSK